MELSPVSTSPASRVVGLLAIVVFAPIAAVMGLFAALFLLQQFINGWIPSRWFSSSGADWIFGAGTQGSASNYIGFMLTALPAAGAGKLVLWGYEILTSRNNADSDSE